MYQFCANFGPIDLKRAASVQEHQNSASVRQGAAASNRRTFSLRSRYFRRQHALVQSKEGIRVDLMASKLHQLQSKASQASQFVAKHGTAYYKQLLEQNKEFIQNPPTVEKCDLLSKQLFYTRLASIPGRNELFRKEVDYLKNLWKNRQDLKRIHRDWLPCLRGINSIDRFCGYGCSWRFSATCLLVEVAVCRGWCCVGLGGHGISTVAL
ncbi:hypothetical protein Nepgr_019906 [Nepenthes gracilis]|uniref:Uncharacterized protein n=1 Tax=Nepenthes gracilis TaxID=150966 RepID=A0AAD3SUE7_NEPGR|nr:hypothetical protein Nepgr_019906 [Nepenthes gracilis]